MHYQFQEEGPGRIFGVSQPQPGVSPCIVKLVKEGHAALYVPGLKLYEVKKITLRGEACSFHGILRA